MTSATKYRVSAETVRNLFAAASLSGIEETSPLSGGEFNAAFSAKGRDGEYVVKIAPPPDAKILTSESGMMRQELAAYALLREKTDIQTPRIHYSDFSGAVIPTAWFVMEKINLPMLADLRLEGEEAALALRKKAEILAQMHRISGPGAGYVQCGLAENWYLAIRGIVMNLADDARRFGKKSPEAETLIAFIDRDKKILEQVPPVFVNFDLWDNNLFYGGPGPEPRLVLVDPERWFWGDPAGDLIALDMTRFDFAQKTAAIEAYNAAAETPLAPDPDLERRYYIMLAWLALIMRTERYSRYRPWNAGWLRNTVFSGMLFKKCFGALNRH